MSRGAAAQSASPSRVSDFRKQHIRDLMVQKVAKICKEQRGCGLSPSQLAFAEEKVDALLAEGRNPTDHALLRIAIEVRDRAMQGRLSRASRGTSQASQAGNQSQVLSSDQKVDSACRHEAPSQASGTQSGMAAVAPRPPPPPGINASSVERTRFQHRQALLAKDMWAQLTKKDIQEYEREEEARRLKMRNRMSAQRTALDEQVEQQKKLKLREREEADKQSKKEERRLEEWKKEAEEMEVQRRRAFERERVERDRQLKDLDERKKMEENFKRREEAEAAAKIKAELEAEQVTNLRKKQRAREHLLKFMTYNAEQRAIKDNQKETENARDKELHDMYVKRLEKQEREREEALRKLYDRQSRQVAMGSRLAAGLQERQEEDERRAAREQAQIQERLAEEEKQKLERLTREKNHIKDHLAKQIREKEDARKADRAQLSSLREQLMADVRAAETSEKEKLRQKRARDLQNRADIERQIKAKADKAPEDFMSGREQQLNNKLIRRLSNPCTY